LRDALTMPTIEHKWSEDVEKHLAAKAKATADAEAAAAAAEAKALAEAEAKVEAEAKELAAAAPVEEVEEAAESEEIEVAPPPASAPVEDKEDLAMRFQRWRTQPEATAPGPVDAEAAFDEYIKEMALEATESLKKVFLKSETAEKTEKSLRLKFMAFDKEKVGAIEVFDFGKMLAACGEASDPEICEEELHHINLNPQGTIDFTEFVKWWVRSQSTK